MQIVGGAGGLNYNSSSPSQHVGSSGTGGAGYSNYLPSGLNVYGTSVLTGLPRSTASAKAIS